MSERAPAVIHRAAPLRPARAEVDLGAIRDNVRALRAQVAPAEVIAVVKADGYGHGAVPVADAALRGGASSLAVALVEEGEELRAAGITAPVLVLSEPPREGAARLVSADLTPSVYTLGFAEALRVEAGRRGRRLPVHLCIDTGMGRVGVPRDQWDRVLRALRTWPELEVVSLWTHYACADEPDHPSVSAQTTSFAEFLQLARTHAYAPRSVHAANSAAALTLPDARFDAVRIGIALYGYAPTRALREHVTLRPALSLISEVSYAKQVRAGTAVSYGHRWTATADGTLATVPLGYADGVPRALSNRGEVLVRGRRCPIVGTITMDQLLVWCGDDDVQAGEEVVLLGRQGDHDVTADDWAEHVGTISYEILTGIGPRVPRVHLEA